jgi:hypothetical protein
MLESIMGHVSFCSRLGVAAALSLFAFTNLASAAELISCRSQAEAAADEWADGRIYPVGPAEMAGHDQVLVISYGRKYVVPRHLNSGLRIVTQGLGGLAGERNAVYQEELTRCLQPRRTIINIYTE